MKTIAIFLDGFRFTYLDPDLTPFLYGLAKDGLLANLNTLPGYHVEYSIFSGSFPTKHNVWGWFYLNPSRSSFRWMRPFVPLLGLFDHSPTDKMLRRFISAVTCLLRLSRGKSRLIPINMLPLKEATRFDIAVDKSYIDQNPLGVPTLLDCLRDARRPYLASEWPMCANQHRIWLSPFERGDGAKLSRLFKEASQHYEFVFTHVWELDSKSHAYGIDSPEVQGHIRFLDSTIGRLVAQFRQAEDANIVVFSEHGMVPVEGVIDLGQTLAAMGFEDGRDYSAFPGSTMAQIWLREPHLQGRIKNELAIQDGLEIYDEDSIHQLMIPYHRDYAGDLLLAVKPGYQFRPNYFQADGVAKAMHGYTQSTPNLDSILIVNGPGVSPKRAENARLVDIAPTLAELMGIEAPAEWDGESLLGNS